MTSIAANKFSKKVLLSALSAALLAVPLSGLTVASAAGAQAFPIPDVAAIDKTAKPNVLVIATGGTISGHVNDGDPTNFQSYKAGSFLMKDMLSQLPGKEKIADVTDYQFGNKGSGGYAIADLYDLSLAVDQALKTYDGVVVTTGTDTMEEIGYFLDLTVRSEKPVVITGSMRPWDAVGTDAPANLYNAIKLSASGETKWYGTVLMLNDEIQAARDVTKSNAHRLDTFDSPLLGDLGYIDQDNISLYRLNGRALKANTAEWATPFDLTKIKKEDLPLVEIAYSYQEAGGGGIEGLVSEGAKGIVTAGTGAGGISSKMGAARTEAIKQGVVFVTTTRTGSGTMYGGGEGIIAGDSLNPQHARIMLLLSLAFSDDFETIKDWFAEYARQDVDQADIVNADPSEGVPGAGGGLPAALSDIGGHWAQASIEKAVAAGIAAGYADGTFKPNQILTRAEFAVMLVNALKAPSAGAELTFTDSERIGKWAADQVSQAVKAGIITGYADGTFRPDAPITRAELAVMIAKAKKYELSADASSGIGFSDDAAIPKWAAAGIKAAKEHGLLAGRSDGRFDSNATATRSEAVAILVKLLQD